MSDIWQKLHERCDDPDADLIYSECDSELVAVMREACDEIEKLRIENEWLRTRNNSDASYTEREVSDE